MSMNYPSLASNPTLFGTVGKQQVMQYTLHNNSGMQVKIITYGAAITNIYTSDRNGIFNDVVLGFDNLEGYLQKGNRYLGAVVGRYANRIDQGKFSINGISYQLNKNRGEHSLHGGVIGLDKVIWKVVDGHGPNRLELSYESKDGDEGFPGNLSIKVCYSLDADNSLKIEYSASTDKPTPVNLTNHSYFNLSAFDEATVLNNELMIDANFCTEVSNELIPTGRIMDVRNCALDFTQPKQIGKDLGNLAAGYDHNFILNKLPQQYAAIASVYDSGSGRFMEVFTDQPGVQFYSGNFLDGSLIGKNGVSYGKYSGLCLETQHYPDSPNHPHFPSTILEPGQVYSYVTTYKFSVR